MGGDRKEELVIVNVRLNLVVHSGYLQTTIRSSEYPRLEYHSTGDLSSGSQSIARCHENFNCERGGI